ncbi:uncharacterized protein FIBRA_05612 [Fibroporia radiculosa]|uniref:Uncharacterized protein n=1 Tax=Fibroporia radiculosa TaxID=599839 RepID=J4H3M0_9APHY|nr:uncharacterized protein FIBRA_05612 [Fibroporia radiculosa]CCM03479.1 predicted protein [Fibroporia radiculosa]
MESSTSKKAREEQRQAEIRKQISLLQAQLDDPADVSPVKSGSVMSPKRKRSNSNVQVPATPSPKRKRTQHPSSESKRQEMPRIQAPKFNATPKDHRSGRIPERAIQVVKPAPSTVIQKLASVHANHTTHTDSVPVTRSSAFADPPVRLAHLGHDSTTPDMQARDDRLALVEELEMGPVDHKAPFDDPRFERLEPNSGIRLSSRSLSHEDFQDYLRGRYYLSPSKLYSVVRLLPNKQGYDVPVSGDWLTIAVVAERGQIKHSQAPVGLGREDKVLEEDEEDSIDQITLHTNDATKAGPSGHARPKKPRKEEAPKPSGKKYVNMKVVDFGCRSRSSASGERATIRGDALLSLLLFESDSYDVVTKENGKKEKIYKGGSRGAFEKMSMLKEGAVVAFLNPRILKPFQRSADAPHPQDNVLAITPESVNSIAVIGHSLDLGMCKASATGTYNMLSRERERAELSSPQGLSRSISPLNLIDPNGIH